MGKKHFCFFQTAETGNRTLKSGVEGSGANHYPRAPAPIIQIQKYRYDEFILKTTYGLHGLFKIITVL